MELKEVKHEGEPRLYIAGQWESVVARSLADGLKPVARGILDATLEAYGAPQRVYHNVTHVADCLRKLEPYHTRPDYQQLWLALLWHDYVYDPHGSDNELRSADWARRNTEWLGLPGADTVHRLIVSTASHRPEREDEALVCAIDMSILAAPPDSYAAYAAAIRQEYGDFPDEEYRRGRIAALRGFTQPFLHPDFVHLTEPALRNMTAEIDALLRQP